jgi:hypothetical protein
MSGVAADLRQRYPEIAWDEPVRVFVAGTLGHSGRWVCRICIATEGLKAKDVDSLSYAFETKAQAEKHIRRARP